MLAKDRWRHVLAWILAKGDLPACVSDHHFRDSTRAGDPA
jgi:hypothetical protein